MTDRSGVARALTVPQVSLPDTTGRLSASTLADNSYEGATISDWDIATTYAVGARVVFPYWPVYQRSGTPGGAGHIVTNSTYWTRVSGFYWDQFTAGGLTATLWNAGTVYALGDYVYNPAATPAAQVRYKVYESLQSGNTGKDPREVDSVWWVEVGPVNRWAMFDTSVLTRSLGNFTITLKIGQDADTVALVGTLGTSVSVHHKTSAGATIVNYGSFSLTDKPNFALTGISTATANSVLEIAFTGTHVGAVAIGMFEGLGQPVAGMRKSRKT